MRNERMREDPREEIDQGVLELFFWQLGALGRGAPLITMLYGPQTTVVSSAEGAPALAGLRWGAAVWDDAVYENIASPPWLISDTMNAAEGDNTLLFATSAEDETGATVPLSFKAAFAWPVGEFWVPIVGRTRAEATMVTPNSVRVTSRNRDTSILTYQVLFLALW